MSVLGSNQLPINPHPISKHVGLLALTGRPREKIAEKLGESGKKRSQHQVNVADGLR